MLAVTRLSYGSSIRRHFEKLGGIVEEPEYKVSGVTVGNTLTSNKFGGFKLFLFFFLFLSLGHITVMFSFTVGDGAAPLFSLLIQVTTLVNANN